MPDHFRQYPGTSFKYIKACADYDPDYNSAMKDSDVIAVLQEQGRACGILGQLYYWGVHTKKDPEMAKHYFNKGKKLRDSQAILFLALMKLAEGDMQGIDDLCFVLGKPGGASIKKGKESKTVQLEAGEALYIIQRWLIKTGRQAELQYYYNRIRQLWDGTLFHDSDMGFAKNIEAEKKPIEILSNWCEAM